jgi:competence protein ComEC
VSATEEAGTGSRSRVAARGETALHDSLDRLRTHPRHVVLGALVTGLLAAPLEPRLVLVLALAAAMLAGRPAVALLAAGAVLAGALGAHARLAGLDRTQLSPQFGRVVTTRVVLLEQPRAVRYGHVVLVRVAGGAGAGERVMLRIGEHVAWPAARTGAVLAVQGRMRPLGPFEQYEARRGAHAALSLDAVAATGVPRGGALGLVDAIRTRAERALSVGLPAAQAALLRGMTLGQDEALDDATREDFRRSSLAHVLAASGQNVALLLALALPLLAYAGLGLRGRLLGALALIVLYVPLAGAGPSIQRAGVMGAATTVAALAGRPASRWYALLLAAAATLIANPRASADPGWQLSFAAVVAIALLAPAMRRTLIARHAPAPVADATAMSLAATLGTAPLLAVHFHQLSLVGIPANLLAAPAVAPITWLGMLSAALGQISPTIAAPLNALNAYLLAYVGSIAHAAASLPHASLSW